MKNKTNLIYSLLMVVPAMTLLNPIINPRPEIRRLETARGIREELVKLGLKPGTKEYRRTYDKFWKNREKSGPKYPSMSGITEKLKAMGLKPRTPEYQKEYNRAYKELNKEKLKAYSSEYKRH